MMAIPSFISWESVSFKGEGEYGWTLDYSSKMVSNLVWTTIQEDARYQLFICKFSKDVAHEGYYNATLGHLQPRGLIIEDPPVFFSIEE